MPGALAFALTIFGCSKPAPQSTPDGTLRLLIDKMEQSKDDPRVMKDAYALLGPSTRANLTERAERASRMQGHRYEPHEMLADGWFSLRFRPTKMRASVQGEEATVEVQGADPAEEAAIRCVRAGSSWQVELDLPVPAQPVRREDGG